jgi:hypothetical protein
MFAATDPKQVVKQSSPTGRTNYGTSLWDKSRFIVLTVVARGFVDREEIEGSITLPRRI